PRKRATGVCSPGSAGGRGPRPAGCLRPRGWDRATASESLPPAAARPAGARAPGGQSPCSEAWPSRSAPGRDIRRTGGYGGKQAPAVLAWLARDARTVIAEGRRGKKSFPNLYNDGICHDGRKWLRAVSLGRYAQQGLGRVLGEADTAPRAVAQFLAIHFE